jgi:hypothetical protein
MRQCGKRLFRLLFAFVLLSKRASCPISQNRPLEAILLCHPVFH